VLPAKSTAGAAPRGRPSAPPQGRPHGGAPTRAAGPTAPAGHGVLRSFLRFARAAARRLGL
jgi:hypothetical protein